jgi:hypothetical protein
LLSHGNGDGQVKLTDIEEKGDGENSLKTTESESDQTVRTSKHWRSELFHHAQSIDSQHEATRTTASRCLAQSEAREN